MKKNSLKSAFNSAPTFLFSFTHAQIGKTPKQFARALAELKVTIPTTEYLARKSLRVVGLDIVNGRVALIAKQVCRDGRAKNRLHWICTSHPTHQIPLSLGIVGRY